MYKAYGMSLSGNCHKVRMVLEHLALPYEWQEISTIRGETRTPEFLAINPMGKVPVLRFEDGRCLCESGAIIQYLANGTSLWPTERYEQAQVLKWMFFEQNIHEVAIAEARFIKRFLDRDHPRQSEVPLKLEKGHAALAVMELHLRDYAFFGSGRCSTADVALFAYTHVAGDGGFDMSLYPNIAAWIARVLEHPGFTRMAA